MTKIYTPKTKDDEVSDINLVQIEQSEDVVDKSTMTLAYLDTEIAVKTTTILTMQNELAKLQEIRALVEVEAAKVKLKTEPEEIPEI